MPTTAVTDTLDLKRLLKVLTDYRRGDFSARMPADRTGIAGKICDTLNDAIERNEKLAKELEFEAGRSDVEITLDKPGSVDVEEHESETLILRILVS